MGIPHVDVKAQYAPLLEELKQRLAAVLESGQFILGPEVSAFEDESADFLGVRDAVGVANGTDALVLVLEALGVGAGDEVICPAFTFYATAEAVSRVGATPVFCDIDAISLNLDPEDVAAKVTARTRAIVAVHLFGRPAPLASLPQGVPIVEDAAQAFGARVGDRRAGAVGVAGTFSFFPTKNLFGLGDGGLVVSNDPELAAPCPPPALPRLPGQGALRCRRPQLAPGRDPGGGAPPLPWSRRPVERCSPGCGGALCGARPGSTLRPARGRARPRLPHVRGALAGARPNRRGIARRGDRLRDLLHDATPPAAGLCGARLPAR